MKYLWRGGLLLMVIVLSAIFIAVNAPAERAQSQQPTLRARQWMPAHVNGCEPWCPTLTPTPSPTVTLTPLPTPTPLPRLAISDLQPKGGDEYIEIYNYGPGIQSLDGWRIWSVVGDQWFDFPQGIHLLDGSWIRVHSGPKATPAAPLHLLWKTNYIWNDKGDEGVLIDALGRVIDRWGYP